MNCPRCGAPCREDARFCGRCGYALAGLLVAGTLLIQRYCVVKVLGRGGFGAVYQASDSRIPGKLWAVKELREVKPEDQAAVERLFQSEAQILAKLNHPALPAVADFFLDGPRRYLVMEYVEGETLLDLLLQGSGPLPEALVMDWARQLCEVLDYLHSQPQPVIHRDVKPENIKRTPSGAIKLLDFGLARTFKGGMQRDTVHSVGTIGYVSPEQAMGARESDARSDVYSLGATLFCMLTRYHPAHNVTPFVFPPLRGLNPGVCSENEAIIMRAVEFDPQLRWQTMREMRAAIERLPTARVAAPAPQAPAPSPVPPSLGPTIDAQAATEHNRQGILHYEAGEYDLALAEYQRAAQLDCRFAAYHYNLAGAYLRLGRLSDGLEEARLATRLDPADSDLWNRLGQICYDLNLHSEALDAANRALQLESGNPVLHYNLGMILVQADRYREAEAAFLAAIDLDADYAPAHDALGDAYMAMDDYAAAAVAYQRAAALRPGKALYHSDLSLAYSALGQHELAKEAVRQAIQLAPNEAVLLNRLGILLYEEGDYAGALDAQQQAVQLDPYDAVYAANCGMDLERLSRITEAIRMYQQAVRLDPSHADAQDRLRALSKR
jgi:serine/threonine-protein kinase